MDYLKKIKSLFSTKHKAVSKASSEVIDTSLMEDGRDFFFDYHNGNYLKIPSASVFADSSIVYSICDSIARLACTIIDFNVVNSKGKEDKQSAEINKMLHNPSLEQTYYEFIYLATVNYLLGECFIYLSKYNISTPYLNVAKLSDVIVYTNDNSTINYFSIMENGVWHDYTTDEVLHIKQVNPLKSVRGFGVETTIYSAIQGLRNSSKAMANVPINAGSRGIVSPKGDSVMMPVDIKTLKTSFNQENSGVNNFAKVNFSQTGVDFSAIGFKPNEMSFDLISLAQIREVCMVFGVPSILYGDTQTMTYNNLNEAKASRITDVVIPTTTIILQSVCNFLTKQKNISNFIVNINKSIIFELHKQTLSESSVILDSLDKGLLTKEQAHNLLFPTLEYKENE